MPVLIKRMLDKGNGDVVYSSCPERMRDALSTPRDGQGKDMAQHNRLHEPASIPEQSSADEPSPAPPPRTVTLRAVLLGLLLMPPNAYWIVQMESVRYSAHPTTLSLFFNCIFILVVLTGLNGIIARLRPRRAFCQGELLLVYTMLCLGSCMASHDFGQVLVPSLSWPFAQANAANSYAPLFGRFLPRWAMVADTDATAGFYTGHDTLYTPAHLAAWLPATFIWTGFVVVLLFVMQCVNVLIRKQWMENERLTFPLARIPLEITDAQPFGRGRSGKSLTHQPLFWLGFALAALGDGVNALHQYFPGSPTIGIAGAAGAQGFGDLGKMLVDKPWSAIGWTPLTYYPFIVGLGMLMPMDFLFSSWFFYLLWKLQSVVVVANAWDADPRMPYANYQALGAYLLFFVSTLYLSRNYLRQVIACALGRPSEINDRDEPLSYRGAFLGMALGLAALTGFAMALGLTWWLALAFFIIYLALALAITRMRAELGTPVHDLHFTGPDWTLTDLLGTQAISAHSLGAFSVLFWFNRAYRSHPMPFQLEGFKLAEQGGARREMRGWFWVMLLAGGFGMLCAFWAITHCYYHYGATAKVATQHGQAAWTRYSGWLNQPKPANSSVGLAIVAGLTFAAFLQAMRIRFFWWPFHPLAYAVSGSWEMNLLWLPLLIAWMVKSIMIRYGGGMKTYTASLPFFYGLILGQFIPGSLLTIVGILTDTFTYPFWQ